MANIINVALIIVYMALTVSGLVIFKMGTNKGITFNLAGGTFFFKFNYLVIIGLCCYVVSFLLYMYIVSKYNLSYIVPITQGIVYVGVFLASVFIFGDKNSALNICGIALVLAGIVLLNIKTH